MAHFVSSIKHDRHVSSCILTLFTDGKVIHTAAIVGKFSHIGSVPTMGAEGTTVHCADAGGMIGIKIA